MCASPTSNMEQLIKRAFAVFGIGIYRLNCARTAAQPGIGDSAVDENTHDRLNARWADDEFVEAYLSPRRLLFYEEVVRLLLAKGTDYNGKRIADVGCGTGHLLRHMHANYNPWSLTGFEYSETALGIAKSVVPDAQFHYLDIYEGTTLKFDVVFCIQVLEHLLLPDKALTNLISMMDESGVAVVTVPDGRTDTFERHINFWSPESWDVFVRGICSGFDVETGLLCGKNPFAIIRRTTSV